MDLEKYVNCFNRAMWYVEEFAREVWHQPHADLKLLIIASLIVVWIFYRKIRNYKRPIRLFSNSLGYVEVTPGALDELVQSVCYEMGTLTKPTVKVYTRRGRLCLYVSIKLEAGQKLAEVSSNLQEELTRACREHLGVEKLGRIDVKVRGFKGLLRKPVQQYEAAKEEPASSESPQENDPFAVRQS